MVEHGDKTAKTEKTEKNTESGGEKSQLKLESVKADRSDAAAMFSHLMPGKNKDKAAGESGDQKERTAVKEKAENPAEKFDPKKNPLSDPDNTSKAVAEAVRKYEERSGKVISDQTAVVRMGGAAYIGQYLYFEEGTSITDGLATLRPLRSGHELELYDRIKNYANSHDIIDPNNKISQEQIMTWSLQVCRNQSDNSVCIQDALLTAHNVMRALARPEVAKLESLPANDPVRHIIEDSTEQNPKGHQPGLPQLMRAKYGLKGVNGETGQDLFDRENPYSVFKPNAEDRNSSTGSAYHFWVGAFAASTLSGPVAKGMVWGEGTVIKGNNSTGQDEKPWGGAGVKAWEQMPSMHWIR